jgi:ATP-dependent 26S proteasome regulatory subunit
MEGIYGTGKTLAAFLVAKKAVRNKWTYIYLKDCKNTASALRICEQYIHGGTGVVLFTEDIDQALRGERDADMQEILNTLDGGDTKCKPIISIFTTNHIEKIEPTFMRGKRIGGLISLGPLDEETAIRFIRVMVPSEESKIKITSEEINISAKYLTGIVPAFASEIIDKAKIFMLERNDSIMNSEDIRKAADSYKKQMVHATMKNQESDEKKLSEALKEIGKYI